MKTNGVMVSEKTLQLIDRLQGTDEMAMIYAEEAENLIDLLLEAQEQYSIIDEKEALHHINVLRLLSKDMALLACGNKEGGVQ